MTATTVDRAERIEESGPFTRGLIWFAVFIGPIGAWAVHLVAFASFVRLTCNTHGGWTWALHGLTATAVVITAVCLLLSWRMVRIGNAEESTDTPPGRLRFLGLLGLGIGAFNVALIVLEEVYTIVLYSRRCL